MTTLEFYLYFALIAAGIVAFAAWLDRRAERRRHKKGNQ